MTIKLAHNQLDRADMKSIHILVGSDNNYLPILGVMLESLMRTNIESRITVHLLLNLAETDASLLARLEAQLSANANCSVDYVDVAGDFAANFSKGYGYVKAAYYRLLAPWLLPELDKVLYLDCDIIVNDDLRELYALELGDNLVAAARDALIIGRVYTQVDNIKEYLTYLDIKHVNGYFNSGVLLMNLAQFRRERLADRMIGFALRHECMFVDQDVLNSICQGRVLYFDARWNSICDGVSKPYPQFAPTETYRDYIASVTNPGIIHYAWTKPWLDISAHESEAWWTTARETPWYEQLLQRLIARHDDKDGRRTATERPHAFERLQKTLDELRKWNETYFEASLINLALEFDGRAAAIIGANLEAVCKTERLVFYGAGYWCRTFLAMFDRLGLRYPCEIWDKHADVEPQSLCKRVNGIPVKAPDYLSLRTGDLLAVTVYDDSAQKAVTEEVGGRAQVLLHNAIKSALGLKLLEMKDRGQC
jgi:lipopolysaccharide biosynthesis glycosyltransferase